MAERSLTVVIPAKNEEETIAEVINRTRDAVDESFSEVNFVVSSGSSDETDQIASDLGAEVIRDGGRGLGEAMYRGLKLAVELETDYILTIDADLQFKPEEATKLIEKHEEADLILGSRFMEDGVEYPMSLSHRFGNWLLTSMVNSFTGLNLTDAQTGYRFMTREVAEELRMVGKHTYVQETIIDAYQNGFTIEEVPITVDQRESGDSKVVSFLWEYAFRTLPVILHRAKMTPYLLNGLSLFALFMAPVILGVSIFLQSINLGVLSFILLLVGLQSLFLGMLIDGELP